MHTSHRKSIHYIPPHRHHPPHPSIHPFNSASASNLENVHVLFGRQRHEVDNCVPAILIIYRIEFIARLWDFLCFNYTWLATIPHYLNSAGELRFVSASNVGGIRETGTENHNLILLEITHPSIILFRSRKKPRKYVICSIQMISVIPQLVVVIIQMETLQKWQYLFRIPSNCVCAFLCVRMIFFFISFSGMAQIMNCVRACFPFVLEHDKEHASAAASFVMPNE